MRKVYLLFAIIGTVFPYYFLVQFLNKNGFDLGLFSRFIICKLDIDLLRC
ncbi:DUF2834 domain-containing protein [Lysinibacillus capsici]|nr:DUF2834 domain-containing protein [Lysinibacillus capsici]MDP1392219.1 DUF2834 domain-containing protein [Lysinibacillus capsici]MDP1412693.1 DUF2834 domain-containing protein [Lysinibacillus capsici]MDP1428674.1 DUF2834 domain-containing protein [Lysinibacillus capsici]